MNRLTGDLAGEAFLVTVWRTGQIQLTPSNTSPFLKKQPCTTHWSGTVHCLYWQSAVASGMDSEAYGLRRHALTGKDRGNSFALCCPLVWQGLEILHGGNTNAAFMPSPKRSRGSSRVAAQRARETSLLSTRSDSHKEERLRHVFPRFPTFCWDKDWDVEDLRISVEEDGSLKCELLWAPATVSVSTLKGELLERAEELAIVAYLTFCPPTNFLLSRLQSLFLSPHNTVAITDSLPPPEPFVALTVTCLMVLGITTERTSFFSVPPGR